MAERAVLTAVSALPITPLMRLTICCATPRMPPCASDSGGNANAPTMMATASVAAMAFRLRRLKTSHAKTPNATKYVIADIVEINSFLCFPFLEFLEQAANRESPCDLRLMCICLLFVPTGRCSYCRRKLLRSLGQIGESVRKSLRQLLIALDRRPVRVSG